MPASFDGNDGNDGNSANSGGGGNATSASSGWFFADRVNLPLVTEPDTGPNASSPPKMLGMLDKINRKNFPDRNWSAEWFSWLALNEFAATPWINIDPTTNVDAKPYWPTWVPAPPAPASITNPLMPVVDWSTLIGNSAGEIDDLVKAATDERADALAEILSQSDEFISYFLNMLTARPGAYPWTTKVLSIASLVGTFVAMYFKALYGRPRPSQLCPALLPPIEVPGHASFPSGHSTQAHLMALCMSQVITGAPMQPTTADDLWTLADRIARNREIAGLHYASDTAAGKAFAICIMTPLASATKRFPYAVTMAQEEWS